MSAARNPLPWLQFDPLIIAGEVDGLSFAEQGAYFVLVRHLWPKGPMPEVDIRRYLRDHADAVLSRLTAYGDGYSMPWIEEAREKASKASEAQAIRASKGWEKRKAVAMSGHAGALPGQCRGNAEEIEKEKRERREGKRKIVDARSRTTTHMGFEEFREACLKVHKERQILSPAEAKAFFDYWTEGHPDTKPRYARQKVFDIGKRMATWNRNNFGKGPPDPPPAPVKLGWLTPTGT